MAISINGNNAAPWYLEPNDCLGDSLGYINQNAAYTTTLAASASLNTLTTNVNNNSTVGQTIVFADVKPANTDAGASTAGAWNVRTLNTILINSHSIAATLATNVFTLPAGTWLIEAKVPGYQTDRQRARIYQTTAPNIIFYGTSEYHGNAVAASTSTLVIGCYVIAPSTTSSFRIEHRVQTGQATFGLGVASNFGSPELYTTVKCTRIKY